MSIQQKLEGITSSLQARLSIKPCMNFHFSYANKLSKSMTSFKLLHIQNATKQG